MHVVLRDLLSKFPSLARHIDEELVSNVITAICPDGVVIGGTYRHYKGKDYVVLGVVRNADDWDGELLVWYVEKGDASHMATRKISHFLGDANDEKYEYKGPRFKWIPK